MNKPIPDTGGRSVQTKDKSESRPELKYLTQILI